MASGTPAAVGARRGTVLLIGNYMPSLVAARTLAGAGYRVIAGDGGEYASVDRSRACAEVWRHPPIADGEAFVLALIGLLQGRPEVSVVLPLRPPYVEALAANRERLPPGPVYATPDASTVLTALDKARMNEVAVAAGISCESVTLATDLPTLRVACERIGFPCVIKPPRDSGAGLPASRKAVICHVPEDLEKAFPRWPQGHVSLMVEPYVRGPRHNVHFAARDGRIVARVEMRSLRTDRLDRTGLSVEAVSVRADPRLVDACDALVRELSYTGVGLAQFIVPTTGVPHFLELNPRLGGQLALVKRCGLDLTLAALDLAGAPAGWQPEPDLRYRVGQRSAWTSRDLYGLLMARARGEAYGRVAMGWLLAALRGALRADVHATWSLRDPMPTVAVYTHLVSAWRHNRAGVSGRA